MKYTKSENEMRKYMVERGDFGLTYDELKDYENFYKHYPNICKEMIQADFGICIDDSYDYSLSYGGTYFSFGKVEGEALGIEKIIVPYDDIMAECFDKAYDYLPYNKRIDLIDSSIFNVYDFDFEEYMRDDGEYRYNVTSEELEKMIEEVEKEVDKFKESKWANMTDSDYDNMVIENCFCEFAEKMLDEMGEELQDLQKERRIKMFAERIIDSLKQNDAHFHTDDFEQKYVYTRHIYEYVPLTYYDEYKTLDEFIDYVKDYYLGSCDEKEFEEYGHEDLWEDIYDKYKVDFQHIYESWKDDFEEQKDKFLSEQDNSPSMKM